MCSFFLSKYHRLNIDNYDYFLYLSTASVGVSWCIFIGLFYNLPVQ